MVAGILLGPDLHKFESYIWAWDWRRALIFFLRQTKKVILLLYNALFMYTSLNLFEKCFLLNMLTFLCLQLLHSMKILCDIKTSAKANRVHFISIIIFKEVQDLSQNDEIDIKF